MGSVDGFDNTVAEVLYDALNSRIVDDEVKDEDLIALKNVVGIEVEVASGASNMPTFRTIPLEQNNIQQWLEKDSIGGSSPSNLRVKLLLGEQMIQHDGLRPEPDVPGIRFSRESVCSNLGISPIALERASQDGSWVLQFPEDNRPSRSSICCGLGLRACSTLWVSCQKDNTIRGTMFLFCGVGWRARNDILKELESLVLFASLPTYLVFAAINTRIKTYGRIGAYHRKEMFRHDLLLLRFPDTQKCNDAYFTIQEAATSNTNFAAETRQLFETVEKLLNNSSNAFCGSSPRNSKMEALEKGFQNALTYYRQVLLLQIETLEQNHRQIARQLDTVQQRMSVNLAGAQKELAEAARKEQFTAIEVAEASRTIAEETKRDGSSMKVLAVVALVYLPATSISSILAMPLFNWDAPGGSVVNPKIWVYFVLAIPLTAVTLGLWVLWLRQNEKSQRSVKKERDATVRC